MFLLFGAFIAGILTVLAPCVLPLLPIIIGGSVTGDTKDKKRPVVIAAALAISLIVFTLLLKATTLFINLPPQVIGYVSGGIIILLGIALLFPMLYVRLISKSGIEWRAQGLLGKGYKNKGGLAGPIIIGAALGPVFSSCSPVYAYILASVLPVNFAQAFVCIIAYVLGLSGVLLLVGYYGQQFVSRIKFAANPKGWFQRTIAVLFILVGIMVFTGYGTTVQTWVSVHTPFNFDGLNTKLLPAPKNKVDNSKLFNVSYDAPEFRGLSNWINSQPLTISQLKGKVVVVDFWTYSCINCIRNNPYLEKWYQAYKNDGLVVIGVHAPEFSFEKIPANVEKAVNDQHITYPVALDNDLTTWNAFSNRSWPASYLIDAQGVVRRLHEGEGGYAQEEQAIRQLLTDNGAKLGASTTPGGDQVPITVQQTPETYFGTARTTDYQGKPIPELSATQQFTAPSSLDTDGWALGGTWEIDADQITARGKSTLSFHVAAKDVYVVGGSASTVSVGITVDGKPISETNFAGSDVKGNFLIMNGSRLYHFVSFPSFSSDHAVQLTVPDGVSLNTFTFGS